MTIKAEIIEDSIAHKTNVRLTTMLLRYPRFIHASPAEHQATPDTSGETDTWTEFDNPNEHGNLRGYRQYRKQIEMRMAA